MRTEEVKRHWRGDFRAAILLTLAFGKVLYGFYVSPRPTEKHTADISIPFSYSSYSSIPPLHPRSIPLLFLLQTSFRPSLCPAWPHVNLLLPYVQPRLFCFLFLLSSILMPVIKNSGRSSFGSPTSSSSSTSSYCRLFRCCPSSDEMLFSPVLFKAQTAISLTTTATVFFDMCVYIYCAFSYYFPIV